MKNPLFYENAGANYHYFGIQGLGAYFEVVVFPRFGFSLGPSVEYSDGAIGLTLSLIWIDLNIRIPVPLAF